MSTTMDIDSVSEGEPLSNEQDYFNTKEQSPSSPAPSFTVQRWKWAACSFAVLSALQFLILIWPKHPSTPENTYENGFSTDFGDAKPHIRLEQRRFDTPTQAMENGTLYRMDNPGERLYTGNYLSEEFDASWEELVGDFCLRNMKSRR